MNSFNHTKFEGIRDKMSDNIIKTDDYKIFIKQIKDRIQSSQIKAAISVNQEMLKLYWFIGSEIVKNQETSHWGDGFLKQISADLKKEFPDMKGFSVRNLELMRKWYRYWIQRDEIAKQVVSQLDHAPIFQIPWGHNILIVRKSNSTKEAFFYVSKTIENNWSRNVLLNQMDSRLHERQGKAISNFDKH